MGDRLYIGMVWMILVHTSGGRDMVAVGGCLALDDSSGVVE